MRYANGFFMRFIQLVGPFWSSENQSQARLQTALLIVLTVMQMVLAVLITEWSAALFNALEQHSMPGLLKQMALLVLIFVASMAVTFNHLKIKRRLQIDWRAWLTERVTGQWMKEGRHYQVTHIQSAEHDNPDGRIAEDIRIATEEAIALCHSLFYSVLLLVGFTTLLWNLSGTVTLDLGAFEITVQGYLVWLAFIYAVSASFLGWRIGRPLTRATDARQTVEANFRFDLVTARENSQAIALIHGENKQRKHLAWLFDDVVEAYHRQTRAMSHIMLFTSGYSVLSMAFPVLVSAPRYILGMISLGSLMQSVQAFQQMTSALSWPVDNMSGVAQWRASVERVLNLVQALDDLEQELVRQDPYRIIVEKSEQPILRFHQLCIAQIDRVACMSAFNEDIRPGEHVLIDGNTASGAKLFKAVAGLWPWGEGRIELPDDEPMFFMPPRPYLPTGALLDAICYPEDRENVDQAELEQLMTWVGLGELIGQLEREDIWYTWLPREQQQRLGVVRLLLKKPKWILIQESFDSLPPEGEIEMFRLICQQLPEATLITISQQPTAEAFHKRRITL
ncbi:MAG: ABC transporter ATP-binding protein/permease [Methylovulum sp.]|uniref:ABC transporter ATP-binding protein/permease n=1 Tax=Methylovulum sp. TaxID=1916980 RepID=UPI00261E4738|nr:ABC transporter ATP-binding protein/permease [Methylovulum sp.]MDD2723654.1 ABC transporter ATP-binding protein/permease [Methylovulum sp.]MDD5123853.1 ABC transporter ATP-binding protein/permease [Methylovulum sp.]